MKAGVFMMPSHPPERSFYDSHYWDLQHLEATSWVFMWPGSVSTLLLRGSPTRLRIC
jgi:hypothetical protein